MFQNFDLGIFLLAVLPVLLAITVHEAAHGYAARYWGDHTAEQMGRLTLNPLAHIDPIGTVVVPAVLFFTTGFMFGWAKPVPVIPRNFRDVRLGMRTVAIAGPLSNLVMAFGWGLVAVAAVYAPESYQLPMSKMAQYGISINAVLFVLNMLPVPPLDGSRFVDSFLPAKQSMQYRKLEPYGTWIILILLMTGVLWSVIGPMVNFIMSLVAGFVGLII
ncbi:site-2 protease family protein [Neisseria yangbaofengii]|uniref:site-2 protease family protein n=1 Tax=Neisseria yangbaofengii TaxID=2709396 RepID=UPI0013ED5604|nr:site-2 protease family protein [Neisseria yangbaofengii]